jgi:hypothetical protein
VLKGGDVLEVYRGDGITYLGKKLPDGSEEFFTLLESGSAIWMTG